MNKYRFAFVIKKYAVVLLLALFWVVMFCFNSSFGTLSNIGSILREASTTGIAALGMTFIIIMGDFDLSIGSMLALLGMILASSIDGMGLVGAICLTIVCGVTCGLLNGFIIAYCRVPAFIATLGTYYVYRALAYIYNNAKTYIITNEYLTSIAGSVGGIPIPFIIFVVLAIISTIVLRRTVYGRQVQAIGNSLRASINSGINTKLIKFLTFGFIGLCTSISTIIMAGRNACAGPDVATNFHFDAITMVVLGGTKMSGGEGSVFNTVIASILYASVANCLVLYHVGAQWERICMSVILLFAFSFDFIQDVFSTTRKKLRTLN
ncbi:MAG: ABC transporter permease [Saccharofermentanales bacterium]|jgi:ribose/xylose/arabinose/galactoside ABC-type transport system permease subunit